ncbi:MAG: hypothetical protein R2734_10450 [Nocardioides sp.]
MADGRRRSAGGRAGLLGAGWWGVPLGALLAVVLAGCGGGQVGPAQVVRGDDDGMNGAVLATPYPVADTPLTDTSGAPFSLATDPHLR